MIVGTGIDVVEISRIEQAMERFGERFLSRVLTAKEHERMPRAGKAAYVAARFAAKEAALKALGTGMSQGISLVDAEVDNLPSGQPQLMLYGAARERANSLGVVRSHISLTHSRISAAAVVVFEA